MIKIKSKVAVEKIKITWRKNGPDFLENEMQCNFTEEEVFFSIRTYKHVQFEQLHRYIQNRNKIYKKWYTQKQSLDINCLVYLGNKKQINKKKQKEDVSSKHIESFIIVVVMNCRD